MKEYYRFVVYIKLFHYVYVLEVICTFSYDSISELLRKKNLGLDVKDELKNRKLNVVKTGLKGIHGEELIYTSTNSLRDKLSVLGNLYKKILNNDSVISKETILIEGYYSATIEGARTTVDYVKNCFSNPKGKDERMVVNTYKAIGYMNGKDIACEEVLLKVWSIIVNGVCENEKSRGIKYRSGMVYVGNGSKVIHTPPNPQKIQEYMNLLYKYIRHGGIYTFQDWLIKSIIGHFYLVYVHPMCDGNGRLARLLMLSLLCREGFTNVLNLSISKSIEESLSGYYRSILVSEERLSLDGFNVLDVTPFIMYMLDVFERSLLMYSMFKETILTTKESVVITKMKRRGIHSEITVEKCSRMLKISESSSRNILNSLTEKNILGKKRVGRKNIYWLL